MVIRIIRAISFINVFSVCRHRLLVWIVWLAGFKSIKHEAEFYGNIYLASTAKMKRKRQRKGKGTGKGKGRVTTKQSTHTDTHTRNQN